MKYYQRFVFIVVIVSIVSLFLEQIHDKVFIAVVISNIVDFLLVALIIGETLYTIITAKYKKIYFLHNWFSLVFTVVFVSLFTYSKFFSTAFISTDWAIFAILLQNIFHLLKIYSRIKKLKGFAEKFTANPAQSILLSFVFVILVGTLLLMMQFTTVDGRGLSFLDALFTAASATCVTGLIVVDTATVYTIWGKLIIILLIQIGGLGIMLLSFFTVFMLGKRISLQDKMLLSYMLSEDDASGLESSVLGIVLTALLIEFIGAVCLFIGFLPTLGFSLKNVSYSMFHSISAFCNAGFALYSDSVETFRLNPVVMFTIAFLIIFGGLGFSVIKNVWDIVKERVSFICSRRKEGCRHELTLNSRIVLFFTAFFLLAGMFFFYILEHDNVMKSYGLGEQYLAAFFQSVTLRTAGFNSVPFSQFRIPTYFFMCLFMFIGAASGGTAGGIKVGTVGVIVAFMRSFLKGDTKTCIRNFQISEKKVQTAFVICVSGLVVCFMAIFVLSITEQQDFIKIVFEVFSAIGTVGLSAGITGSLSAIGKCVIIILMFWGRVGALTILSVAAFHGEKVNISWPQAEISIG